MTIIIITQTLSLKLILTIGPKHSQKIGAQTDVVYKNHNKRLHCNKGAQSSESDMDVSGGDDCYSGAHRTVSPALGLMQPSSHSRPASAMLTIWDDTIRDDMGWQNMYINCMSNNNNNKMHHRNARCKMLKPARQTRPPPPPPPTLSNGRTKPRYINFFRSRHYLSSCSFGFCLHPNPSS